uniref:Uncharacterized protein n=1 Tax=Brugia malayi TaxID=6279 RepID=A8QG42_BRUMA
MPECSSTAMVIDRNRQCCSGFIVARQYCQGEYASQPAIESATHILRVAEVLSTSKL